MMKWNPDLFNNILNHYSKTFCDEDDLFNCIQWLNYSPKVIIFRFNSKYSWKFVKRLVIFQILNRILGKAPTGCAGVNKNFDYYLFCFRLLDFLQDLNLSTWTNVKDLYHVVHSCANTFDISHYSEKEIDQIMHFAVEWIRNGARFHTEILSSQSMLFNLDKIFRILKEDYEYFKRDYDFISLLGYGAEGAVFKVIHKESKLLRALKLNFEGCESTKANQVIDLLKRNDIEGKIKHFDGGIINYHLYSVMELGEESLADYIARNNNCGIYENISKEKLQEMLLIFIKILQSVNSIHDHNILHRDLDPKNILKVQDEYKVIDFETSTVVKTGNSITVGLGKLLYMAPEASIENYSEKRIECNVGQLTISSNLFSLGCIFLKLLTNCSLQVNSQFIQDPNMSNYDNSYNYFNQNGYNFFSLATTAEGETKLHYAIEKLIKNKINPDFKVSDILTSCIITMIQRDNTKRLNCYSYKTILENVLKFLQGEIQDCTTNVKLDLKMIQKESDLAYAFLTRDSEIIDEVLQSKHNIGFNELITQIYYSANYFQYFTLEKSGEIHSKYCFKEIYEWLDYRNAFEILLEKVISKSKVINHMALRHILTHKYEGFFFWEDYFVKMLAELLANNYSSISKKSNSFTLKDPQIDRTARSSIGKGVSKVKLNGKDVAEKVAHQELAENELEMFKKIHSLSQDGVVELLHHYIDDSGSTHLFLELMDCSLEYYSFYCVTSLGYGEALQILFVCLKVAETMKALHRENIIHYDIKPANILIRTVKVGDRRLVKDVKIADFDVSLSVDNIETYSATFAGTFQYMAPELILRRDKKLPKGFKFIFPALDVYSFGVTMFELFSGRHATQHERVATFDEVYFIEELPCLEASISTELVRIVNSCLHEDPSQRPTFETIQQTLLEITTSLFCTFRERVIDNDFPYCN